MKVTLYCLEQLFPDVNNGVSWIETGEEYDNMEDIYERLNQLKKDGKTGFRIIYKTIEAKVLKTI